jgi:hypothetical protein
MCVCVCVCVFLCQIKRHLSAACPLELFEVESHVLHATPQDLDLVVLVRLLFCHYLAQLLERFVEHIDRHLDGVWPCLLAHASVEEAKRIAGVETQGDDVLSLQPRLPTRCQVQKTLQLPPIMPCVCVCVCVCARMHACIHRYRHSNEAWCMCKNITHTYV